MKTWTYGINTHYKQGTLYLTTMPLWLYLVGDVLIESVISRVCCLFHWMKLPNIKYKTIQEGTDTYTYTWSEYYGDVGEIFRLLVFFPLSMWYWRHPKRKETPIELGYDKVKELFYTDNPKFFDDEEAIVIEEN